MKTQLQDMQAVILCGGQGTRIRAVAEDKPKPMVEIGGKPILWHIMKYYASYGVRKFILALGYQGGVIVDYFANYQLRHRDLTINTRDSSARLFHPGAIETHVDDWEITMVHTGINTMTGGRLLRIAPHLQGKRFFVTYGDGVSDVDLQALLTFHENHGKCATLTGVHLPTTFGIVDADESGVLQSFREKPNMDGYINGGYFVFEHDLLDEIKGDHTVLEAEPFRNLVEKKQLCMYRHDQFWHCMDHYKDYSELNELWAKGNAPWKRW